MANICFKHSELSIKSKELIDELFDDLSGELKKRIYNDLDFLFPKVNIDKKESKQKKERSFKR